MAMSLWLRTIARSRVGGAAHPFISGDAGGLGWAAISAAAAMVFGLVASPFASAAPLETYGQLPMIERVAISPDGKLIALALTNGEKRLVEVKNVASGKILTGVNCGDQKIRDIRFAGDDDIIITASVTGLIADVDSARLESFLPRI
jgi:hypothetical protein